MILEDAQGGARCFAVEEWGVSHEHFIKDNAHRIDICAMVEWFVVALFGGHVGRGAEGALGHLCGLEGFSIHGFGNPKVEDFDVVRIAFSFDQKDIVGFEVAVDDFFLVGCVHCVTELAEDVEAKLE